MEEEEEENESEWVPVFSSVDHNMTHPGKVYSIHQSGGHFLNPNGTLKYVHVMTPESRCHLPYHELNGARIYRAPSTGVRAVGVSHKRTLNLTGTMGDLLFKIEPAVLNAVPDVRFVKLESSRDYAFIMATDGVWDHLSFQGGQDTVQNDKVFSVLKAAVQSGEELGRLRSIASKSSASKMTSRRNVGTSGGNGEVHPGGVKAKEVEKVLQGLFEEGSVVDGEVVSEDSNAGLRVRGSTSSTPDYVSVSSSSTAVAGGDAERVGGGSAGRKGGKLCGGVSGGSKGRSDKSVLMKGAVLERLQDAASCLVSREFGSLTALPCGIPEWLDGKVGGELYTQRQTRYDDCTAFVVYLKSA